MEVQKAIQPICKECNYRGSLYEFGKEGQENEQQAIVSAAATERCCGGHVFLTGHRVNFEVVLVEPA